MMGSLEGNTYQPGKRGGLGVGGGGGGGGGTNQELSLHRALSPLGRGNNFQRKEKGIPRPCWKEHGYEGKDTSFL